jgi:hypothetical protein
MNLASCFPPRFRSIVKLVSCPENENGNLCFVMPPLVVWLAEQAKVIEHSFCYVIYSTFVMVYIPHVHFLTSNTCYQFHIKMPKSYEIPPLYLIQTFMCLTYTLQHSHKPINTKRTHDIYNTYNKQHHKTFFSISISNLQILFALIVLYYVPQYHSLQRLNVMFKIEILF